MPDPTGIPGDGGSSRCIGAAKGLHIAGLEDWAGSIGTGRPYVIGVEKNSLTGDPDAPCLQLSQPTFWQFRWIVHPGTRTISVNTMQTANQSPYPSLVVKANPAIGVMSDAVVTSTGGIVWVTIGPVTIIPSSTGLVWVQLWNNLCVSNSPALFDHIVVT